MRSPLIGLCLVLISAISAQAADTSVTIKNFNFAMDVTVTPGSTVTWKNLDGEPHTVASADGLFRSPALDQNDSYSFKFEKPGVYKYICSIHPKMRATVTVQ
jgi:plastocyanin